MIPFRSVVCLSLLITLVTAAPQSGWANTRVDWRRSMLCGTLLNAMNSGTLGVPEVIKPSEVPAELVLIDHEISGAEPARRFAEALSAAHTELKTESRAARNPIKATSLRNFVHRMNASRMYVSDAVYASVGLFVTAQAIYGTFDLAMHRPDSLFVWAHFVALLGAAGAFDYPIRWLTSYDRGLPKLIKEVRAFERGLVGTFEWKREFRVSQAFVTKLRVGTRLTWADLHDQNEREELPGAWRYFRYRHDVGQMPYVVNLDVEGNRATDRLRVLMTARPLEP